MAICLKRENPESAAFFLKEEAESGFSIIVSVDFYAITLVQLAQTYDFGGSRSESIDVILLQR